MPTLRLIDRRGTRERIVVPVLGEGGPVGWALVNFKKLKFRPILEPDDHAPYLIKCLDGIILVAKRQKDGNFFILAKRAEQCRPGEDIGRAYLDDRTRCATNTVREFLDGLTELEKKHEPKA